MDFLNVIVAVLTIILIITLNLNELYIFTNGDKLQAIFDFAMMASNVSFWTWLMVIFKK